MVLKVTPETSSKQSLLKVSLKKQLSKSPLRRRVIANQMIKYHFPHTRFDQIGDHKHDILVWKAVH